MADDSVTQNIEAKKANYHVVTGDGNAVIPDTEIDTVISFISSPISNQIPADNTPHFISSMVNTPNNLESSSEDSSFIEDDELMIPDSPEIEVKQSFLNVEPEISLEQLNQPVTEIVVNSNLNGEVEVNQVIGEIQPELNLVPENLELEKIQPELNLVSENTKIEEIQLVSNLLPQNTQFQEIQAVLNRVPQNAEFQEIQPELNLVSENPKTEGIQPEFNLVSEKTELEKTQPVSNLVPENTELEKTQLVSNLVSENPKTEETQPELNLVPENTKLEKTQPESNLVSETTKPDTQPVAENSKTDDLITSLNGIITDDNPEAIVTPANHNIQVKIHHEPERLVITLPSESQSSNIEYTWTEIWQQLKQRLNAGDRLRVPNTNVHLVVGDRLLDARQLQELAESLSEVKLQLKSVCTSRRQTAIASVTAGYSVEQNQLTAKNSLAADFSQNVSPLSEPLYMETTIRSGIEIRHPGTVAILGDVNPGGSIIADGDILVWGRLRGIAHAGARGNSECLIMALQMEPTQLRIADAVARAPEKPPKNVNPEVAYITPQGIRIVKASDFSRNKVNSTS
jgi:septum site-determining protein MinC